jgi:hypothetical protein
MQRLPARACGGWESATCWPSVALAAACTKWVSAREKYGTLSGQLVCRPGRRDTRQLVERDDDAPELHKITIPLNFCDRSCNRSA